MPRTLGSGEWSLHALHARSVLDRIDALGLEGVRPYTVNGLGAIVAPNHHAVEVLVGEIEGLREEVVHLRAEVARLRGG